MHGNLISWPTAKNRLLFEENMMSAKTMMCSGTFRRLSLNFKVSEV